MHTCNPRTQEVKAGGSSHPWLNKEFKDSLGHEIIQIKQNKYLVSLQVYSGPLLPFVFWVALCVVSQRGYYVAYFGL